MKLGTLFKKEKPRTYPKILIREPGYLIELPKVRSIRKLDVKYPLLEPLAFANVKWNQEKKIITYSVTEPVLTDREKSLLEKIKSDIMELLDTELTTLNEKGNAMEYLENKVKKVLADEAFRVSKKEYMKIMYFIFRDFIGLNEIEPMMHDPYIEDIGCDGVKTPVYVVHTRYGSLRSSIIYNEIETLNNFVVKLSERCGRYISYAKPLLDGSLPDGSRVQASLAKDVTTRGPTFSIRKFRKFPLSPIELMNMGTFLSSSMCRTGMPAMSSADSNVKLHPKRNATRSSCHTERRSVTSPARLPSR